jgi:hypothetical protein
MKFEIGQVIKFYSISTPYKIRYSIIREIYDMEQIGIESNKTTENIIQDYSENQNFDLIYIWTNASWKIEILDIDEVEYKLTYGDIIYGEVVY